MADSGLFKELYCSVCLGVFIDPVSLPCDHIFCRLCILKCQGARGSKCPECRATFAAGTMKSNRALRNMADRLRAELYLCTCPEHQEKMKLFCQTDKQLICVVCRDGKTHRDHVCLPISEAAALSKGELEKTLGFLSKDNGALAGLISAQDGEIRKIKNKSKQLTAEISAGFRELRIFLHKKEEELKEEVEQEEKNALGPMQKNMAAMTQALNPRLEKEQTLLSGLDIEECDLFQKWWLDTGSAIVDGLKNLPSGGSKRQSQPPEGEWKSEADGHRVTLDTPCSISLGPYESHLQLFVWKEMLQVIRRVPERVTVEDPEVGVLMVSGDRSSVRHVDVRSWGPWARWRDPEFIMSQTWSEQGFQSGQHYWEVTVGEKPHWSLGLAADPHGKREAICRLNGRFGKHRFKTRREVPLDLRTRPQVVGTYLDCERKRMAFYNALSATLIASATYDTDKPLFAYFNPGFYLRGENADPLTVRWY